MKSMVNQWGQTLLIWNGHWDHKDAKSSVRPGSFLEEKQDYRAIAPHVRYTALR